MADYLVTDTELTSIANAIRTKGGTSAQLTFPTDFVSAINAIPTGGSPNLQTKSKTYIPTMSQQTEQITADGGYDGLQEVDITVNAMQTQSLPSGTDSSHFGTRKAIIPASATDRYLNIPTGYNGSSQYYTLSAVQLGSKSITANGTYNASSDSLDGFSSVTVNVSGGGTSKNAQTLQSTTRTTSTSYTKLCGDLTVSKTGTYDVYWTAFRSSTSGTWGTQLYIGSTAYGSAQTTYSNHVQNVHLSNVSLTANQKISVYGRSRGSNSYAYVGTLTIIQA